MPQHPIERAKNRASSILAKLDAALEKGEIDEERWYREVWSVLTPAYLDADNPRAQSGHSGGEAHWIQARSLVCDTVDRDGVFPDIGCANGHLMNRIHRRIAYLGHQARTRQLARFLWKRVAYDRCKNPEADLTAKKRAALSERTALAFN